MTVSEYYNSGAIPNDFKEELKSSGRDFAFYDNMLQGFEFTGTAVELLPDFDLMAKALHSTTNEAETWYITLQKDRSDYIKVRVESEHIAEDEASIGAGLLGKQCTSGGKSDAQDKRPSSDYAEKAHPNKKPRSSSEAAYWERHIRSIKE
jgi:hypothetical protein